MNMETKRNITSWVLLAVFVPMLLLSSVHIHHNGAAEASAVECMHDHCLGHMTKQAPGIHACVLCQFLTLSFVAAGIAAVVLYHKDCKIKFAQLRYSTQLEVCGIPTLRAPPSVW